MTFDPDMQGIYERGPLNGDLELTLRIEEHNSGTSVSFPPWEEYPPPVVVA